MTAIWIVRFIYWLQIVSIAQAAPQLTLERTEEPGPDGEMLPVLHVGLFGSISLPENSFFSVARVRIFDVTEPDVRLPVRSLMEGTTDSDGMFFWFFPFDVPNGTYQFHRLNLCSIALLGLHAPYSGGRRFEINVEFSDRADGHIYSHAVNTFFFIEDRPGYLELQDLFVKGESLAATLTDLFNSDGSQETMSAIASCVAEIHALDIQGLAESAYLSCLQSASSSSSLRRDKLSTLDLIARLLDLPVSLISELNDRHLRLTTMQELSDIEMLGLPDGLSPDELRDLLALEYRKWRGRATHSDRAISAEATARLEMIARVRATLS
ncbi:MAG: hypothetical protein IPI24_07150 [Ignavibacteria bacterium]|nr:hypothetical protein [Ignavibacteria bacterium]MBK7413694.1 hypothetical protein [Ignavibacteria bacterium]MBK7577194.1 hypothetical protein [Ignavibacteria bacterium]